MRIARTLQLQPQRRVVRRRQHDLPAILTGWGKRFPEREPQARHVREPGTCFVAVWQPRHHADNLQSFPPLIILPARSHVPLDGAVGEAFLQRDDPFVCVAQKLFQRLKLFLRPVRIALSQIIFDLLKRALRRSPHPRRRRAQLAEPVFFLAGRDHLAGRRLKLIPPARQIRFARRQERSGKFCTEHTARRAEDSQLPLRQGEQQRHRARRVLAAGPDVAVVIESFQRFVVRQHHQPAPPRPAEIVVPLLIIQKRPQRLRPRLRDRQRPQRHPKEPAGMSFLALPITQRGRPGEQRRRVGFAGQQRTDQSARRILAVVVG